MEDPALEQHPGAEPGTDLLPGLRRRRCSYFVEQALAEVTPAETQTWTEFKVPEEAIGCGFHEAVRGVLSHHVVIRDGKIANYHPYPPTCWNASPRDSDGIPGPYEDAVQNTPIFEENGPDNFKGIDIMRTVRSFDPCLPCGVHMIVLQRTRSAPPADVWRAASRLTAHPMLTPEQFNEAHGCVGQRITEKLRSSPTIPPRSPRSTCCTLGERTAKGCSACYR